MAEAKKVKLIAGANPIWTGAARIQPGEAFEVPEAKAERLLKKRAAMAAPVEETTKGSKGAREAKKGAE